MEGIEFCSPYAKSMPTKVIKCTSDDKRGLNSILLKDYIN